jgi:predicted dehydrogenase
MSSGPHSISPGTVSRAVRSKGLPRPALTTYAIIGNGWRSTVYLHLAYLFPERFRVTGVFTRRADAGEAIEREWGVPTHRTLDELVAAERPDFVIPAVPWEIAPELTRELVARGIRVLTETPPAPDLDGMRRLWSEVGGSGLVQVAEQYPLMPLHAARLSLVRDGIIGTPTSVHVSSTHLYHVVALVRGLLGVEFEPATVLSQTFTAPLVDPITPAGWTGDSSAKPARSILSTIDFGEGRTGVYDFTDNQWWNPLRPDHLSVRGSVGELHDETVVRLVDGVTPVASTISRVRSGVGMNYEGADLQHVTLDGRVLFRNEFEGGRLNDDEIGVAALLSATGAWARDEGEPPYPLAQGMLDHQMGIAIEESATSGRAVTTSPEPWWV